MNILSNPRRFELLLDGKDIWSLNPAVAQSEDGSVTTTTVTAGNLRITNIARSIPGRDACEWYNLLENTGDTPTGIISELWDCVCTFPLPHEEPRRWTAVQPDLKKATKIFAPTGSTWAAEEFYCDPDKLVGNRRVNHIYAGESRDYTTTGGRSSEAQAPFFNIHKDGHGVVAAVGWTGQWRCRITRGGEDVTIRSGIDGLNFRLLPGEKIRTSSVVLMSYDCDAIDSQNKWRRLVKDEFSQAGKRVEYAPLCASFWGGSPSDTMLERVETIRAGGIPYEYIWIDAGWYGIDSQPSPNEFEGNWGSFTGDWRVSPHTHPGGLRDVSRAIHEAGMKLLLWFEPERVRENTPIVTEHPEYFLGEGGNRLLNLGNPGAWNYICELLSGMIRELSIDCYRQDFNFAPLNLWRANDAEDRQGITEIKHITGMYALWDALLERFPNLIIDNCASGGRRIDIETLRRSIPLWRSDFYCPANFDVEVAQMHNLTFGSWMPYSGSAIKGCDPYNIRSGYAPAVSSMQFYYADGVPEDFEQQRWQCREYLRVRPYLSEDFYPLTEPSPKLDVWCAAQYNRPSHGDGLLQIFRRENAPYDSAVFRLRGIDADADYILEDLDGGEIKLTGTELSNLRLTIDQPRTAKLYIYKKV
ncbi:MAG: alpha-galactosidase [Clostridia bacterium]|nr:alpha-galactosidase [Clostridia bacterium]